MSSAAAGTAAFTSAFSSGRGRKGPGGMGEDPMGAFLAFVGVCVVLAGVLIALSL